MQLLPRYNHIGYTQDELDRIGNTIIFLSNKIERLSKTKLLKLVYLLDEVSIKKYGVPFLNLEYKVWQAGPVNLELFNELSSGPFLLKNYIRTEITSKKECYITGKKSFDNDEFSDNDIDLLEEISSTYGKLSAQKLVELCHRPHTLWYRIAKQENLLEAFNQNLLRTSDFEINFSDYIVNSSEKQQLEEHKNFLNFSKNFKG
jgi:uncharacterized phage-associated protein